MDPDQMAKTEASIKKDKTGVSTTHIKDNG